MRSSSEQARQLNSETIYFDKDQLLPVLPVLPWKSYLFSYNSRIKFHGNMNHDKMNQWSFKALIYELVWQFEEQSLGCLANSALLKESQDVISKWGRGDFLSFYVDTSNMTSTTFTMGQESVNLTIGQEPVLATGIWKFKKNPIDFNGKKCYQVIKYGLLFHVKILWGFYSYPT